MADVKIIKAWGGFSEGHLDIRKLDAPVYDEPRYAIFKGKRAAQAAYEDVRPVEIVIRPA